MEPYDLEILEGLQEDCGTQITEITEFNLLIKRRDK